MLVSGCADMARLVTPSGSSDSRQPAQVAFSTSVTTANTLTLADVVQLRVAASYVITGGARVAIGNQTIPLSASQTQAVPIPVDLATCMSDAKRDGGESETGCPVVLVLSLVVNNVVVDNQTIGPLRLAPGATASIEKPVALFEITAIELTPNASDAFIIGSTRVITPVIRDSRGTIVQGRTVVWASETPTVATVSETGVVTALAEGSARITATVGAVSNAIVVNVSRPPVALSVIPAAGASGTGLIQSTPSGISCRVDGATVSGTCSFDFDADAEVVLQSVADAGQTFGAWGGSCVGQAVGASCTLRMAEAQRVSARFLAPRRITVSALNTDGRGRVTGTAGMDCQIDGNAASGVCAVDVPEGTTVTLTSVADGASPPDVAQHFAGWGGACATVTGATCTLVAADGAQNVTAGYFGGRALNVVMAGDGGGMVTTTTGISCTRSENVNTGVCTANAVHGSTVVLSVVANALSEFTGWSGACDGQSANCIVSLTEPQTAIATFARRQVPLTINVNGSGNGTVFANGVPICSRQSYQPAVVTCVTDFAASSVLTITTVAGAVTDVAGMTGDCNGQTACVLTMNSAHMITALFAAKPPVTLTIEGISTGSGTIRSSEAEPLIDCPVRNGVASGPKCSTNVPIGTQLTLTAVGDAANALRFWAGACATATTSRCAVTMNSSATATVGFTPAIDVEMQISGSGSGTVFFEPNGAPSQLPCVLPASGSPVSCRFALPSGLSGIFRGQAGTGSTFQGIVGPCAEGAGGVPVPVCTYRGIGFLRVFKAVFAGTP